MEFDDFLNVEKSEAKRRRIENMYPDALRVTLEMATPHFFFVVSKTTLDPTGERKIIPGVQFVFVRDRDPNDGDVVYKSREAVHIFNRLDNSLRFVRAYLCLTEVPRAITYTDQRDVRINKEMRWALIFSDINGEGRTKHDIIVNEQRFDLHMSEHDVKFSPRFIGFTTLLPNNIGLLEVEVEETKIEDRMIKLISATKGARDPWMKKW